MDKVCGKGLNAEVLKNVDDKHQIELFVENNDVIQPLPSFYDQIAALVLCIRTCDIYNSTCSICKHFASLRQSVQQERNNAFQQITLDRLLQ